MALKSSTFLNNLLFIAAEQYDFIVGGGGGGGGLCGGCHRCNLGRGVGAKWTNAPSVIFLLKNSFFFLDTELNMDT